MFSHRSSSRYYFILQTLSLNPVRQKHYGNVLFDSFNYFYSLITIIRSFNNIEHFNDVNKRYIDLEFKRRKPNKNNLENKSCQENLLV